VIKTPTPPLLILDLDECLIHAHDSPLDRPADFRIGPFHVYQRPHVGEFLQAASQWYQLAVWSSATSDYVEAIVQRIQPQNLNWQFVWGRDRCTRRYDMEYMEEGYVKDLKKAKRLGFTLERILFVDDTPSKLARNYGNAIYIKPFEGPLEDEELLHLAKYLETIRHVEDFRKMEKRNWRHIR
jgi:RNA polymerase II subunit A small phosphatase-like protein